MTVSGNGGRVSSQHIARMLHVSRESVARWSREKKLPYTMTLGGHRRYDEDEVRRAVARLGLFPDAQQATKERNDER